MSSFYTKEELKSVGFKYVGGGTLISRKASIYGAENISIGQNVRIDDFCILSGKIEIGNYVHIAAGVMLFGGEDGILLRDYVGISSRSVIYAASDDYSGQYMTNPTVPEQYRHIISKTVCMEKHVLIGTGCTVLPGVRIGEGTSVGSMSLVNQSLDAWGIYVGIPCRRMKERSKDLLLLERNMFAERGLK